MAAGVFKLALSHLYVKQPEISLSMSPEAMMKHFVWIFAVILAVASFGTAYAQSAASVVTSSTSDATTSAVRDAVSGATSDALKTEQKSDAAKAEEIKKQAKKAEDAKKKIGK